MNKGTVLWGLVVCLSAWPQSVTAQLVQCGITANAVAFGAYDPLGTVPTNGTGDVQVSCRQMGVGSLFVDYKILLSAGSSGSFVSRKMTSDEVQALHYNLFVDVSRSTVWGDGNSGTSVVSDRVHLTPGMQTVTRNYPVYGRLFARQDVLAGMYSDAIIVTVNY